MNHSVLEQSAHLQAAGAPASFFTALKDKSLEMHETVLGDTLGG